MTGTETTEPRCSGSFKAGLNVLLDVIFRLEKHAEALGIELLISNVSVYAERKSTIQVDNPLDVLFKGEEAFVTETAVYQTIDVMFHGVTVQQIVWKTHQFSTDKKIVLNG